MSLCFFTANECLIPQKKKKERRRGEEKGLQVNILELPREFIIEAFTHIWYTFIIYKYPYPELPTHH